jgi:hypothetical protein
LPDFEKLSCLERAVNRDKPFLQGKYIIESACEITNQIYSGLMGQA